MFHFGFRPPVARRGPFSGSRTQAPSAHGILPMLAAGQSHFNDLCALLGQPTPTDVDPDGRFFTFEKGASKVGGGDGWADVWYRQHFGWEYNGKYANLEKAYEQLLRYKDDLENPPLLIVCDLTTFIIHTNFTNTVKTTYTFTLADLTEPATCCRCSSGAVKWPGRWRTSCKRRDRARPMACSCKRCHGVRRNPAKSSITTTSPCSTRASSTKS